MSVFEKIFNITQRMRALEQNKAKSIFQFINKRPDIKQGIVYGTTTHL